MKSNSRTRVSGDEKKKHKAKRRRELAESRRMLKAKLGDPRDFRYGQDAWWGSHIQPYALLREMLKGEGLHQHHLIPKSLFLRGPKKTRGVIDYIPAITLSPGEHLSTLHSVLNAFLKENGVWKTTLTTKQLQAAIGLTASFYEDYELDQFAEALREFEREVFAKAIE